MECPGIPIALLLITLLGIATMGVIFYLKVVAAGRRRRSANSPDTEDWLLLLSVGRHRPLPASAK
jgi:hypothetical protein